MNKLDINTFIERDRVANGKMYQLKKILKDAIHEFEIEELNYIKKQNNGRTKH